MHAPLTHVWLLHAMAAAHWPLALQVCTPLPEHWVCPGLQATQEPLRQAGVPPPQATEAPQLPVELHVSTPLPAHRVLPAAQEPLQTPDTHVLATHAVGVPHMPPVHVCTPLPEHCRLPLLQAPVQTPLTHVLLVQATAVPHCPVEVHVSTPLPEHWVEPGAHATQAPLRQAGVSLGHAEAVPHCPVAPQVCRSLASAHRVAPGPQVPVHVPSTHAMFAQVVGEPHSLPEVQTSALLPEHCMVPGAQATHWPPTQAGAAPEQAGPIVCHWPLLLHT